MNTIIQNSLLNRWCFPATEKASLWRLQINFNIFPAVGYRLGCCHGHHEIIFAGTFGYNTRWNRLIFPFLKKYSEGQLFRKYFNICFVL